MAHCGVHLGEDEEEDLDFVNALCCGPAHVGEEEHGGGLAQAGDQARLEWNSLTSPSWAGGTVSQHMHGRIWNMEREIFPPNKSHVTA